MIYSMVNLLTILYELDLIVTISISASLELLDELAKFPYGTLNHFVYYCYKNNGSTLGGLMRFFTKKYGLNVKAQNFAMDLGVCLGIANKVKIDP